MLIDGHSMAYRAFYALPVENFSTTTGQPTNAVYGFTSMLIRVLGDERPTQANRSASPQEFSGQVDLVKEVLAALRVRTLELPGYEADDIIATMTRRAEAEGMEVLICSGDRDAMQLVSENTTLLYPVRGVSELIRVTPQAVHEKYGVGPDRYSDLAALVGESSDNLPGVPGVGPKTAAKWITTFGDLDGIIADVDQIKGKAAGNLREMLDQVIRNRQLNQLVDTLDLGVTPEDLKLLGWDRDEVHRVFDGLEFRVLRDRLFEELRAPEPEADHGFEMDITQPAGAQVTAWFDAHTAPAAGPAGVSVSGVLGVGSPDAGADAYGLAVAAPDGASAWFDLAGLDPAGERALRTWLADEDRPKVMHDAKPELHALLARDMPLAGLAGDTKLAAYLSRPDQRSYDLADLSIRHLHRELRAEVADQPVEPSGQTQLQLGEESAAADRAGHAVRAAAIVELDHALTEELSGRGGTMLLHNVELPLIDVLRRMETDGIAASMTRLDELATQYDAGVERSARAAYDSIDRTVNLGSPKQLQEVLFDQLGLPKTKRIKTGYTTDADALADLYAKTEHPFLAHLLEHRDVIRLRQTVEGLRRSVAADDRIHTTYSQTVAATGRLSSTEPNLQNIPIRTEAGRQIRECFVAGPQFDCLLSADYSQIEMRIMAHMSGDDGLIDAFRSGEDLHSFVASRVFEVPADEVSAQMRSKIKAMSYGLAYGLSAFGLSRQLRISTEEARQLMQEYFERFGGVRDYLHEVVDVARKQGYTETVMGRRRYLPDLDSTNRQRREMAERMALNAPIQGSAADIIKMAMLGVEDQLRAERLASRMLLQVHDELIVEVAPGERDQVEAVVREQMSGAMELTVPLDVSVGSGQSWYEAAH
ncbi:MAG: DNA polymerase I [Micrococcales bacterium]|nr:MAG: DNA polymerase I [Micrococcales bacterium]